ncbi:MAG: alpha/beta hydrolase [Pseudomonadota bacterium]
MPMFTRDDISLYYEIHGEGFPVLLFAPGGMRSAIDFWGKAGPWNTIEVLKPHFKVIAMDQRNAGQSTAPVSADDGWHTYTADHVALLDHLGVDKCHGVGMCIGGPYWAVLIEAIPDRVASVVMQQPIGLHNNREAFYDMFDGWANEIRNSKPGVSEQDWSSFRSNMYDNEFLLNVSEDFIRQCNTPMMVMMGSDLYHPEATSRRIAEIAPNATFLEDWKNDASAPQMVDFLKQHTP